MPTVVAVLTPIPGGLDALVAAFHAVVLDVHKEPGCLLYSAHADGERLIMIESWRTAEDLDAHKQSAAVVRLGELRSEALAHRAAYVLEEVISDVAAATLRINRE